ncbi:MAG: hypothetical protein O7I42_12820 [Alphaproteobacteria bacterium]|nr:hypothetical protein [Alphaproteobacteria bacterium]
MEKVCIAEIYGLHDFFVDWLTGALPKTGQAFARCAGALAEGFVLIGPQGLATPRKRLLDQLEGAHGVHAEADPLFTIRIENPELLHRWEDYALFTYQEWQDGGASGTTGRLSTVLFARDSSAPASVAWLHLHETWIDGHGP